MSTMEQMIEKYAEYQIEWKESEVCSALEEMLEKKKDKMGIRNVVCFGIGSFERTKNEERSYTHLAGLMTIINLFKKSNHIKYIAQDPDFTDLDTQFLSRFGFEITEDPYGFRRVDENTFVHVIQCDVWLWSDLLTMPQPAAMMADYQFRKGITEHLYDYEKMNLPLYGDTTKGEPEEPHDWVSLFFRR